MLRGESRATATSKMERFVIIVNGWSPLTIITNRSILNVAAVLDSPLMLGCTCMRVCLCVCWRPLLFPYQGFIQAVLLMLVFEMLYVAKNNHEIILKCKLAFWSGVGYAVHDGALAGVLGAKTLKSFDRLKLSNILNSSKYIIQK